MAKPTHCQRCGVALGTDLTCSRCGTHYLSPDRFPLTLKIYSGTTDALLWSRVITIDEARTIAKIEIPGYAGSEHHPVRTEITYADGTTDVGGMQ